MLVSYSTIESRALTKILPFRPHNGRGFTFVQPSFYKYTTFRTLPGSHFFFSFFWLRHLWQSIISSSWRAIESSNTFSSDHRLFLPFDQLCGIAASDAYISYPSWTLDLQSLSQRGCLTALWSIPMENYQLLHPTHIENLLQPPT